MNRNQRNALLELHAMGALNIDERRKFTDIKPQLNPDFLVIHSEKYQKMMRPARQALWLIALWIIGCYLVRWVWRGGPNKPD